MIRIRAWFFLVALPSLGLLLAGCSESDSDIADAVVEDHQSSGQIVFFDSPLWKVDSFWWPFDIDCIALGETNKGSLSCSLTHWAGEMERGSFDYIANFEHVGFNDRATGIEVPAGKCLVVTQHAGFRGKRLVLPEGRYWHMMFPYSMNDKISAAALPILQEGVDGLDEKQTCDLKYMLKIYEHAYGKGSIWPATEAVHQLEGFNDSASSLDVPPGLEITLYEHDDYQGRSLTFGEGSHNLPDHDFNDMASSFKVRRVPQ